MDVHGLVSPDDGVPHLTRVAVVLCSLRPGVDLDGRGAQLEDLLQMDIATQAEGGQMIAIKTTFSEMVEMFLLEEEAGLAMRLVWSAYLGKMLKMSLIHSPFSF